jgi:hypothetical protein
VLLASSLAEVRKRIKGLFAYAESTSENMMQLEKSEVPGQLAFFVVALRAHGLEPVSNDGCDRVADAPERAVWCLRAWAGSQRRSALLW